MKEGVKGLKIGDEVVYFSGKAILKCTVESIDKKKDSAKLNTGIVVSRKYGKDRELTIINSNFREQKVFAMGIMANKLLCLDKVRISVDTIEKYTDVMEEGSLKNLKLEKLEQLSKCFTDLSDLMMSISESMEKKKPNNDLPF